VPTWINEVIRPETESAIRALKRNFPDAFRHTTPDQMVAKARRIEQGIPACQILSDDISGFDDSVGSSLQEQIYEQVLRPVFGWKTDILKYSLTLPILTGPYLSATRATLVKRRGGICSGLLTTTLEGNLLNFGCVLEGVAAALKLTVPAAWNAFKTRQWHAFIQGDDTLLFVPPRFDEKAYIETALELGLTRKLNRQPVFLMTWLDVKTGASWGLSARAVTRTATRERPAAGVATELLGAAIRWGRCLRDPLFWYHWRLCVPNPLFDRFKIRTWNDLLRVCASHKFLSLAEDEVFKSPQGEEHWGDSLEAAFSLHDSNDADTTIVLTLPPALKLAVDALGGLRAWLSRRAQPPQSALPKWRELLAAKGPSARLQATIQEDSHDQ
jgi:hypothetical protein